MREAYSGGPLGTRWSGRVPPAPLSLIPQPHRPEFLFGFVRRIGQCDLHSLVGPLFGFGAGWIVDRFGPRRLMMAGILMAGGALVGLGVTSVAWTQLVVQRFACTACQPISIGSVAVTVMV